MRRDYPRVSRVCLSTAFAVVLAVPAAGGEGAAAVEFNRDVRPLLSDRCFHCHGPDARHRKAGLRLDTAEGAHGERGGVRAIVPGEPAASEVIRRVTHEDPAERMPPAASGKNLSAAEVETLRRWIAAGGEYEEHWIYVPPRRRPLPSVADRSWPREAIDHFVLAPLEAAGLRTSPEADEVTLVRRLHQDLAGLPPTPAEVDAYLADASVDRYERLVDRLLASPRFGERLAIYWLDLVRYADTVGYHGDQEHPISPYRDWVIEALNDDMPFDRFTIEQLAGDLLPDATVEQRIASGYNRLLQTTHEGGAQDREYLAKYAADRVRNVSGVWLGATLGCAECHDHKYDPFTSKDFYSLAAFFADVKEQGAYNSPNTSPTTRPPELAVLSRAERAESARLERTIVELEAELAGLAGGATLADARTELERRIESLRRDRERLAKGARRTMVTEPTTPRVMRVLARGDWMDEKGEIVEPAIPRALGALATGSRRATRLDLARWLVAADNPLTARVLVNRLWYLFFGEGLSRVLEDTGSQGEWPTHPALLDALALEFVAIGQGIKAIVRRIVLSSTYRQSSLGPAEMRERDPDNRLLARQGRYRLPAELIRDSALAVSGLLVGDVGGRSARPYQPAGYYAHLNFPEREYRADRDRAQYRRGVYTHWQRQFLHPMLRAFDAPSREECAARRPLSNTPLAALTLLNDPTFVEAARKFAERIIEEGGRDDVARVTWAWRVALARRPAPAEVAALVRLLETDREEYRRDERAARELLAVGLAAAREVAAPAELAAWTSVARAILNLNETITRN